MENTDKENFTVQYCFPGNNASCRKEVRSDPAHILLFIFLSCISVCTVFLNLLVIISISHFKQLHTPTNLLILSLAVADLLMGMFVMPVKITQLKDSCWYFGDTACSVFQMINSYSLTASLYNLVLIAVDRYIAVSDPLHYSIRITICNTSLFISLGWSFTLLYITIFFYFNDHLLSSQIITSCYGECVITVKYSWVIIDLFISFLAPCSVILVLYSIVFFAARRQAKAVRAVNNPLKINKSTRTSESKAAKKAARPVTRSHRSESHSSARSSESKAATTLGLVVFVYLGCWIPYFVSSLSVESVKTSSFVVTVFIWLICFNSAVNPLIYAIFYPWFRTSVKFVLTCKIFESSSSLFRVLPECF